MSAATPRPLEPSAAERFREFFARCGYDEAGLAARLGGASPASPQMRNRARLRDATRDLDPEGILIRWFLLADSVNHSQATRALPPWMLESAFDAGLLRRDGEVLEPCVLIVPCEGLLLAYDRFDVADSPDGDAYVLAVGPSARHLNRAVMRIPVRTTLDLGCGCGFLGLLAASHSARVVATDLNQRAVDFAGFNGALNGIRNLECLTGDLYAPSADRTYDLILCNPPFIVAPPGSAMATHNPCDLDEFSRKVVAGAPRHLTEGGFLQMVCEWVEIEGQAWYDRLGAWFAGTGCDAMVFSGPPLDAESYALMRLRETPDRGAEADDALYRSWVEYYRAHRVNRVRGGTIVLRRRTGANWVRIDESPANPEGLLGDSIHGLFRARDFLESHASENALLDSRLRVSREGRLIREDAPSSDDGWMPESLRLVLRVGFRPQAAVDTDTAWFVARFDGRRPCREVVAELADRFGRPTADVAPAAIETIRGLVEQGFLVPAGPAPQAAMP